MFFAFIDDVISLINDTPLQNSELVTWELKTVYLPYYAQIDKEVCYGSTFILERQQERNAENVNENLKQVELIIENSISSEDDQEFDEP